MSMSMTTTTTATTFAVYYRSATPKRGRTWTLHNVFPTREQANRSAAEIASKFKHLDLWTTAIEATATAATELTPAGHKSFKLRHHQGATT